MTQEEFNSLMTDWLSENGGTYNSAYTGPQIDSAIGAVSNKADKVSPVTICENVEVEITSPVEHIFPYLFVPILGNVYKVLWDGVEYICTGNLLLDSYPAIGDVNYQDFPFIIVYMGEYELTAVAAAEIGTYTVSIYDLGKSFEHFAAIDDIGNLAPSGKQPGDFAPTVHNHTKSQITDFPASMTPTAHKATHAKGGTDELGAEIIGVPDPTASLYGLPDPTVNDLFGVLSGAAMIDKSGGEPIYTPVSVNLATATPGTEVWIGENGVATKYIVAQKNYEGSGAILLMRSTSTANVQWNTSNNTAYAGSAIDNLCATHKSKLSADVQNKLRPVNIPYTIGGGNGSLSTLLRDCFLPSRAEMGAPSSPATANVEGSAFAYIPNNFLTTTSIWTRTPHLTQTTWVFWTVNLAGSTAGAPTTSMGFAPCFTFKPDATITWYTDGTNIYADQAYTPITYAAATVLGNIIGGFTRIETGEYTGTGTSGAGNPNVLTAPFDAKILIIYSQYDITFITPNNEYVLSIGLTGNIGDIGTANARRLNYSWLGRLISWYGNTATVHLNNNGILYKYIFVG